MMTQKTHPKVKSVLTENGFSAIPEAHTYLKINNVIRDLSGAEIGEESFQETLQMEMEIEPDQIGEFKVNWHKAQLVAYSFENGVSPNELWMVREKCILAIAQ